MDTEPKKMVLAAFMLPTDLLGELREVSKRIGEPQSLIVRQALRKKLGELNRQKKNEVTRI